MTATPKTIDLTNVKTPLVHTHGGCIAAREARKARKAQGKPRKITDARFYHLIGHSICWVLIVVPSVYMAGDVWSR